MQYLERRKINFKLNKRYIYTDKKLSICSALCHVCFSVALKITKNLQKFHTQLKILLLVKHKKNKLF